jgi:MarR family transcriptional regulator, 2-MHQ and catechol-resistance regulon repressor
MSRASEASGTHLWLVLMKARRALARHATRSIEAAGIGLSDFATLELLLHKGPQPVNEIGRRIDLTSGSITSAVDRLEKRGLVARGFDPDDRRARIVRLTPEGEAMISGVFTGHKAAMDHAAGGLSKAERATLIDLLKRLGISAEERFEAGGHDHD